MKRSLIIANCLALVIGAAICVPFLMHGHHPSEHVVVHFQKLALSTTK